MKGQLEKFYENYDEEGRLFRDKAHLPEYLTTIRYFDKLFKPESTILDACAGTGKYSFYLAKKGYKVTALDLVKHNVEIIKSKPEANLLSSVDVCNVLDLSRFENESFDIVLCMGAMYHLKNADEKKNAITECVRVCKTGGLVVLSYLNRYAVIAAEVNHGLDNLNETIAAFEDTSDFIFRATTPSDMVSFSTFCGLDLLHNIGADGISFVLAEKVNKASDEDFEKWMEYIYSTCEEPSILGYSMHGLFIGKKL